MTIGSQSNGSKPKELRSTLVIAHPGHELRVHNWLETFRPDVWVLTDGSGKTQISRLGSTTRVLDRVGSRPGPVFGQMRDADLYEAILGLNHGPFIQLVDQLSDSLINGQIEFIAGDAEEGYNPAHDVCRLVINSAVDLVKHKTGQALVNYDFTLMGSPNRGSSDLLDSSLSFILDDEAFVRKLAAARNYPELKAEVEAALQGAVPEVFRDDEVLSQRMRTKFGVTDASTFRVECLRPVKPNRIATKTFPDDTPFYEAYGEKQINDGHYRQVLRYREHIQPLADALRAKVESNSGRT